MPERDSGPQRACDAVFQLYEGGEQQRVLLAFEEQFARQPEAAVGAKECDVRGAAPDLPAEHNVDVAERAEPSCRRRQCDLTHSAPPLPRVGGSDGCLYPAVTSISS